MPAFRKNRLQRRAVAGMQLALVVQRFYVVQHSPL